MNLRVLWSLFVPSVIMSVGASWFGDQFYRIGSYITEVCHSPSIKFDPADLKKNFDSRVFGQPFLYNLLLPLLTLHLSESPDNRKALVFSFHGTQGSGKTHVAKIIAESIYGKGMDSQFVHLFKPILHFSGRSTDDLKSRLQEWVHGNVTRCNRQLFIFDEVNDMPEGILEAVKGFIDYSPKFGGLDYSKCIFIFLSNIAMKPINQKMLELWRSGNRNRDLLEHDDFHKIVLTHAFNEEGGFKKCKLISSRLIDAFVPFLPLERNHVENCIRVIAGQYSEMPIRDETIELILENVEFVPEGLFLYSADGCKNLDTPVKLALIKHDYKIKDEL